MSLLQPITEEQLQAQEIKQTAETIKKSPLQILNNIYNDWLQAFNKLHGFDDPQRRAKLLEAIGTDGAELFALNNVITSFMIQQLTGKRDDIVREIQAKLASLPEFNINQDGTVTVNSEI